jgi:hypothetical protein
MRSQSCYKKGKTFAIVLYPLLINQNNYWPLWSTYDEIINIIAIIPIGIKKFNEWLFYWSYSIKHGPK